jgi:hypothetical protein
MIAIRDFYVTAKRKYPDRKNLVAVSLGEKS